MPKTERAEAFLTTVDTQRNYSNLAQSEVDVTSIADSLVMRMPPSALRSQSVVKERPSQQIYVFADDQFIKADTPCFKFDLATAQAATVDDILDSFSQKMGQEYKSLFTLEGKKMVSVRQIP